MNITEGKCYSIGEYRTYLSELGFDWLEHKHTAVGRGYIVARKP